MLSIRCIDGRDIFEPTMDLLYEKAGRAQRPVVEAIAWAAVSYDYVASFKRDHDLSFLA
jgi:hypothetical protein